LGPQKLEALCHGRGSSCLGPALLEAKKSMLTMETVLDEGEMKTNMQFG